MPLLGKGGVASRAEVPSPFWRSNRYLLSFYILQNVQKNHSFKVTPLANLTYPNIEIVSSACPCGVTYLLNILLELDIKIFAGPEHLFWRKDSESFSVNPLLRKKFGLWVPSLHKAQFRFSDCEPAVEWSHTWPYSLTPGTKRIVFIRDPRDALFSEWRRRKSSTSFRAFIASPMPPLGLNRVDTFALTYALWGVLSRNYADSETLLIRFEDIKQMPELWVKMVLNLVGINRPDEEISRAIEASQTDRVRNHFQASLEKAGLTGKVDEIIGKGKSFEWMTDTERSRIMLFETPFVSRLLRSSNYEVVYEAPANPGAYNPDAALKITNALYGKSPSWLTLSDRTEVERVVGSYLKDHGYSGSRPRVPYCLSRRIRITFFSVAILILSALHLIGRNMCPSLSRFIEKIILRYRLGQ